MIERQTIGGRGASIAYIKSDMSPATKDVHDYAKIIFDDGEMLFVTGPDDSAQEAAGFTKHRERHRVSQDEIAARTESKAESDAWVRHRARLSPQTMASTSRGILGLSYAKWAAFFVRDDIARIDNAIRTGLIAGLDNLEIARSVVGSIALKGADGATEVTRQRMARLGHATIKPKRKS